MDILTPKGQVTLRHEQRAAEIFEKAFGAHYVSTPKDQPASVDAMILHNEKIRGVVETKCRGMDLSQFQGRFESQWLITLDKLERGRELAAGLGVPFFGLLYLIPDDTILFQKLSDQRGEWVGKLSIERTMTQATVNGGLASRVNAYVDMAAARLVRGAEVGSG